MTQQKIIREHKVKCIACCGKGFVMRKHTPTKVTKAQKLKAVKLYQQGLSFREICAKTKITHPYSVQHIIRTANTLQD